MTLRSVIAGVGSYLPDRVVTNDDMAKMVETNDEWIVERTGIRERRFVEKGTTTSMIATKASEKALKMAGMEANDIDVIILATITPDKTFPASAVYVQAALGMTRGFAFDISAACSGFLYAMNLADGMIRMGQVKTALVIGVETLSCFTDFTDRNTCILFGDGAGAAILRAEENNGTVADRGIIDTVLYSDGRYAEELCTTGGPSFNHDVGYVKMNGREVFRHAGANMAEASLEVMKRNNVTIEEIDWMVPHQANVRILDATAKKLGFPNEKVIVTVDRHANTSAASIPLALAESVENGTIKQGQLMLLPAMGGGFTWGAGLIRL